MKKQVYVIIVLAAVLTAYFLYQPEARKSIFTETLGEVQLTRYGTGDVAAREISNVPRLRDIPMTKGYFAVYTGKNGTMRIWIVEANHNIAYDAFNAMNSKLGLSTEQYEHEFSGDIGQTELYNNHNENIGLKGNVFTKPMKVDMPDILKPEIYLMKSDNLYIYYYLKMDYKTGRVYWIAFDYPDMGYQKAMLKQAIFKI